MCILAVCVHVVDEYCCCLCVIELLRLCCISFFVVCVESCDYLAYCVSVLQFVYVLLLNLAISLHFNELQVCGRLMFECLC